jgi:hypothetical protein
MTTVMTDNAPGDRAMTVWRIRTARGLAAASLRVAAGHWAAAKGALRLARHYAPGTPERRLLRRQARRCLASRVAEREAAAAWSELAAVLGEQAGRAP